MNKATTDQLPPHSLEAEQAILGSVLLDPASIERVVEDMRNGAECFYDLRNRRIYQAMVTLYEKGTPVTSLTVGNILRSNRRLVEAGGIEYIAGLPEQYPSTGVGYFIGLVLDHYIRRQLLATCAEAMLDAQDATNPVSELVDKIESKFSKIDTIRKAVGAMPLSEVVSLALQELDKITTEGVNPGLPSGLEDLDQVTGGFVDGDMIIFAARPSVGKTALGLNICEYLAVDKKIPVAFVSLETKAKQLVTRLLSSRAGVNSFVMRKGLMNEEQMKLVNVAGLQLRRAPLIIDDTRGINVLQLRAKARRMKSQHGIRLLVLDYIQLMIGARGLDSRAREMSQISAGIKDLAGELNIPIIVLSQLNREIERRQTTTVAKKPPKLSDLKECMAIENSFIYTTRGIQKNSYKEMDVHTLGPTMCIRHSKNIPKDTADVLEIQASSGRSVSCTPNHLLLTDRGWIPAGEISLSDSLACVQRIDEPLGTRRIEVARWIGWMLGNGAMQGPAVPSFICSCQTVAEMFYKTSLAMFGFSPKYKRHKCSQVWQYDLTKNSVRVSGGNPVTRWLKVHDLWGRKSFDKYIPEWFLSEADNWSLAELVAGLIETDGSVTVRGSEKVRHKLSIATTSQFMAKQLLWCFSRLGLFARMSCQPVGRNPKAKHDLFVIGIEEGRELDRAKKVLKINGRKGEVFNSLKFHQKGSHFGNRLGLWAGEEIKRLSTLSGISWRMLGYRVQGKRISQSDLIKVIDRLESFGCDCSKLRSVINPDVHWDRIKSITQGGCVDVFDRSVSQTHNFVVNGIVVHNSGALEQDGDLIGLMWMPESLVEVRIAKARNGPTGVVPLVFDKTITKFSCPVRVAEDDTSVPAMAPDYNPYG